MTQTKAELLQTRHQGDIRLGDADSSHYVGFKAPATVGTSLVWTLPAADGTANYLLKTDGSGNLGWVADSSTDSTKMPLAGGIFTGDVTFDGATAGRDIVFDRSDNALEFADNAKATFGDSGDLAIWHNSSDNFIDTKWNLTIRKDAGAETLAKFNNNGAVELFYDNVKTFETLSAGIKVSGAEGANAEVFIDADEGDDDNDKWKFVAFNGEGALRFYNYTSGGWEQNIGMLGNGAVELYYNNEKTFETLQNGVRILGSEGNYAYLHMWEDEGDDNADKWRMEVAGGSFKLANYSTGSWVNGLILDGSNNATFAGTVSDSLGNVRKIPNDTKTSANTLVASDSGKMIRITTGGITVNNSVFAEGDVVSLINQSGSDQTITAGAGFSLYNSGDGSAGNRTLAGRGMATMMFAAADAAYISGSGLS